MSAYTYTFAGGFKQEYAQTVGELCEKLEASDGGLTPQTLLDASRDESSPTHALFEWDDTKAAEKWRLEQASSLIRNIRIVRTDDTEERKALKDKGFVVTPGRQSAYVSLDTALHRENYRAYLIEQAKRDCETFEAKYRRVSELASVIAAMDEFVEKVG